MRKLPKAPVEWTRCQVGDVVASISSGVSVNSEDRAADQTEIGILKTSCVYTGRFRPDENKLVIDADLARVREPVRAGTIIVSRMNTPELVGACGFVESATENRFLPDRLWQIRTHGEVDARWLSTVIGSKKCRQLIQAMATGTSQSMKNISQEAFSSLPLTLPPLPEQRRIAEILRTWDEAIEKTERLIAAKEKRRDALLIDLENGRFGPAKSRARWVAVTVADIMSLASRRVDWDERATYRLITVKRASGGIVFRGDKLGSEIKTKDMYEVRAGDFVISKRQVVHGAWAMATPTHDRTHVSKEYACFEPRGGKLWMPFFGWLSRTKRLRHIALLCSYGVDIEKMVLDMDWLQESRVLIPEFVTEQKRIAEVLDCAELEIDLLRRERDTLDTQKRGLMQKLLTGEWRVAVDGPVAAPAKKRVAR